jgi:RHS repeat-associated protein
MVQSDLPGAGVIHRNVIHDYTPQSSDDTADPGAVRALRDVLTNEERATLTYDASGNLMTRRGAGGQRRFQYDGDDSLRMAVDSDTGATEIHYYDHTGERVLTYQRDASGTSTVRHRFHGTELFYDTGGAATKSTVDVELGDHPVLRVTRESTTKVEHLFHGSLASLLAVTDATGQGTARYGYGAFGEVLYAEGPAESTFDRRFNGKADDAISGLRYYGARYYDPLTLSWTQADPMYRYAPEAGLLDPLRMSLYAFSLNNPIRFLDPDGREANTPRGQMLRATAKVMGIDPGENFGWDRAQDSAGGVIELASGFENHYHPKQEWTWHNTVASFGAGLGDAMTFGITREIRHGLDVGTKTVDESSLTYGSGTFAGVVVMAFLGARAGGG